MTERHFDVERRKAIWGWTNFGRPIKQRLIVTGYAQPMYRAFVYIGIATGIAWSLVSVLAVAGVF
jgi:hypothetical protein